MTATSKPSSFSIELALVVGLPLLTVVAGAYAMCLAYTQGFTPVENAAAAGCRPPSLARAAGEGEIACGAGGGVRARGG